MKYSAKDLCKLSSGRRHIRDVANTKYYPIELIQGKTPPIIKGDSFYYETLTGIRINYPSAYAKKGWRSMVYCSSTIRIEVGNEWVSSKNFRFDQKKSVDFLSYSLNNIGFVVVKNSFVKTYHIISGNKTLCYWDLSLSQFRNMAQRITKFVTFN